jgi:hypothetical protein
MIYILDKNGHIVGSADGPVNVDDLASRGESTVVSELALPLAGLEVVGFPTGPTIIERRLPGVVGTITLTTTAEDADGDGLPELPANGRSQTTLTAMLRDTEGREIQEPIDVRFRTSAGTLSRRTVSAENGLATVRLTASRETVLASVRASAAGFASADLDLEFVPPEG